MEGETANANDDRPLLCGNIQDEEEPKGCCSAVLCNPSHSCHRFIALIFMCLISFGSDFCYDNPGALQDNFKDDLRISASQFVLLYSIYSWPNIVLCFVGGVLIDRVFGIRFGTILYMSILLTGALIFATGGYFDIFWLMVVGRFIFGIGGESLVVAQSNYAVRWFKGKELNMVFGLQLSFSGIGSTINFIVMEPLYKLVGQHFTGYHRTGVVLYIASLTCVLSLIFGLILAWMDRRAERVLNKDENTDDEPVKLSAIKYFSGSFWLVTVISVAYYVAIFPFVGLGKMFFERKFNYSPEDANVVNCIIYILSAAASPAAGFIIDKTGRNIYWVVSSIFLTIGAHSILTFTFWNPFIGMTLLGLSYSIFASALWPLVALIIPENQLGTAYGICQAFQNLSFAVVSIITGMIVDNGGYFMLELFFLGSLFVALIAAICMVLLDSSQNGILNMTEHERGIQTEKAKAPGNTNPDISELLQNYSVERNSDETDLVTSNRIRSRYLTRIGTHSEEALLN